MTRLFLILLLTAAALLTAPGALGQPPYGIVRPENPGELTDLELGQQLYAGNCAACHGSNGQGVPPPEEDFVGGAFPGYGPPLVGVGALSVDFYLRTGYMPLGDPEEQPSRGRVLFSEREILALIEYVTTFGGGPDIPEPEPEEGSLSEGFELYTEFCAGCHQAAIEGGVVTGALAPPLEDATVRQIAQAVRIGPHVMPAFPESLITDEQLNSIIAYVEEAKEPRDEGGWGIGHLGPVPEGLVTWFFAATVLVAVCVVIGRRLRR